MGERDENTCREDFAPTDAVALAADLEAHEHAQAKERMIAAHASCANLAQLDQGKTRDRVGAAVGMSGWTYQKAKAVVEAAEKEPELFGDLPDKMDETGKVDRAYVEMRRRQKLAENEELVKQAAPILDTGHGPSFPTIVLDPPWDWGDEGDVSQFGRGRPVYATMSLGDLLALPVGERAQPNAHIYLWITNRSLSKGFALLDAWGFRYVTMLTWVKPSFGMGNYFRGSTEHVLFGVRGSLPLLRHDMGTHFLAARGGKTHSSKPEEFYRIVETCSPGPWLEMFARHERPGWAVWGAEVGT